jgi:hypothetical protein
MSLFFVINSSPSAKPALADLTGTHKGPGNALRKISAIFLIAHVSSMLSDIVSTTSLALYCHHSSRKGYSLDHLAGKIDDLPQTEHHDTSLPYIAHLGSADHILCFLRRCMYYKKWEKQYFT